MGIQIQKPVIAPPPAAILRNRKLSSSRSKQAIPKKNLIRRRDRDYSQALRRGYQFAFLLMNVWLGSRFYLWVRQYETAGTSAYVSRPAGVEGWLPIAGMMNLKYFLVTRQVPELHPAAMFLLVTFVAMAFLFRKAFCSWLCPVGFGVFVEAGTEIVSAKFSFAGLGGYPAARVEVLASGIFRVGGFDHVGFGNCRIYAEPVRRGRGCEDAELFPVHRDNRSDCAGRAGGGFGAGAEFLVPVFVSVWGIAGVGFAVQSHADSPEC